YAVEWSQKSLSWRPPTKLAHFASVCDAEFVAVVRSYLEAAAWSMDAVQLGIFAKYVTRVIEEAKTKALSYSYHTTSSSTSSTSTSMSRTNGKNVEVNEDDKHHGARGSGRGRQRIAVLEPVDIGEKVVEVQSG
ncbi:unnamed protein product, partial [Amoebophrya sp. A25]